MDLYAIVPDRCVLCDACRTACPRFAISVHETAPTYVIDPNECNGCNNMSSVRCIPQCPTDAIILVSRAGSGDD